jgi:hypothetical protein
VDFFSYNKSKQEKPTTPIIRLFLALSPIHPPHPTRQIPPTPSRPHPGKRVKLFCGFNITISIVKKLAIHTIIF